MTIIVIMFCKKRSDHPVIYRCKSVTIMGTVYRVEKCWLMIGTTDIPLGTVPKFGHLHDVLLAGEEPSIYFVFIAMDTLNYDPILGAYEVRKLNQYQCLYSSLISNFCYHPLNAVQCGNSLLQLF